MDDRDKLTILLAEYSSLRMWIFNRGGNIYQLGSLGPIALGFLLTLTTGLASAVILLVGAFVIIFGLWHAITDIRLADFRLLELEHEINKRAGETLLQWETMFGGRVGRRWYDRVVGIWPNRHPAL